MLKSVKFFKKIMNHGLVQILFCEEWVILSFLFSAAKTQFSIIPILKAEL